MLQAVYQKWANFVGRKYAKPIWQWRSLSYCFRCYMAGGWAKTWISCAKQRWDYCGRWFPFHLVWFRKEVMREFFMLIQLMFEYNLFIIQYKIAEWDILYECKWCLKNWRVSKQQKYNWLRIYFLCHKRLRFAHMRQSWAKNSVLRHLISVFENESVEWESRFARL